MAEILEQVMIILEDIRFYIKEIYNRIIALFGEEE